VREPFISKDPQLEDYWRGIILYGRNVASYKFALAKALLELKPQSGQLIKLSDLAPSFAINISEHIKSAPKQTTSKSSKFLDYCKQYSQQELDKDELINQTIKHGFNNVIDAFHVVGSGAIPKQFYIDEREKNDGIRITDEFSELLDSKQESNLDHEVEARWRLVETAWELGISHNLIAIHHDFQSNDLYSIDKSNSRKNVTSCRHALNGYQKGKCFYCESDIFISTLSGVEVDHFFPHKLKQAGLNNIDGVWNLVLACESCNRGERGKFDKLPDLEFLEKLFKRNQFLIASHHPLRETLIKQTGQGEDKQRIFLNDMYNEAKRHIFHKWSPLLD